MLVWHYAGYICVFRSVVIFQIGGPQPGPFTNENADVRGVEQVMSDSH